MTKEKSKISAHQLYFETSFYERISLKDLEKNIFTGEVDAYSWENSIDTTYSISNSESDSLMYSISNKTLQYINYWNWNDLKWYFSVELKCKRKDNDYLKFYFITWGDIIIKIWQYPALADLQFAEIWKKYDQILDKEDLINFKKAIWLYTHSAWAWSFIYLRKIFENLIWNTFTDNKASISKNKDDFKKLHMSEKVKIIKGFLPDEISSFMSIYKILSVGVHELSEQDCLKYFNIMKLSIELILEEKIKANKEKERNDKITKELAEITKELS